MKRMIQKFSITSNTVVLAKRGTAMADPITLRTFEDVVKQMGLHNVLVIVVDEFDDARVLNNLDMNRLGWYRLPDVRRLTNRIPSLKSTGAEPKEEIKESESN